MYRERGEELMDLRYLLQTRQPPSFRQSTSLTPTYKQTSAPWQKLGILQLLYTFANMGKDPRSRSKIEQLCRAQVSVSAEYAKNAEQTPGEIAQKLYGSHVSRRMSTEHPSQM